jgi:hypothetical protein
MDGCRTQNTNEMMEIEEAHKFRTGGISLEIINIRYH